MEGKKNMVVVMVHQADRKIININSSFIHHSSWHACYANHENRAQDLKRLDVLWIFIWTFSIHLLWCNQLGNVTVGTGSLPSKGGKHICVV